MKKWLLLIMLFLAIATWAQPTTQTPIEEPHDSALLWKALSIAIGLGLGIAVYMLIKKNPRKDAV